MRTQSEAAMRLETIISNVESFREFRARKREEAALLVRCLLRREGLESDVRYTAGGLSISFRGTSPDFDPDNPAGLLGLLMAIAHLLEEEHNAGPDFVINVDFWGSGCMVTTVGKATKLAAWTKERRITTDEFQEAFDFRMTGVSARRLVTQ